MKCLLQNLIENSYNDSKFGPVPTKDMQKKNSVGANLPHILSWQIPPKFSYLCKIFENKYGDSKNIVRFTFTIIEMTEF